MLVRSLLPLPVALLALPGCLPELPETKNSAPSAPIVSVGPTTARTGDDLVAVIDVQAEDADGDAIVYTFVWKQNGLPREDLTSERVSASETSKGENWEVLVTPFDGERSGPTGSATVTILNTAPEVTVTFTPAAPVTGDDVVAVPTATDADGDLVTLTYAWTLDGAPQTEIGDRIAADRTEHGQTWSVTVTPTDEEESGAPVTTDVTIANDPPVMLSVRLEPEAPFVSDNV